MKIFIKGCTALKVDERFCMNVKTLDSRDNIVDVLINLYAVSVAAAKEDLIETRIEACQEILYSVKDKLQREKYIGRVNESYDWVRGFSLASGYGKLIWRGDKCGDSFQGKFISNDYEHGVYYEKSNELRYEGDFQNGLLDGKGIMHCCGKKNNDFGTVYVGDWKKFKFHGSGKLVFCDKAVYQGQWKNGKPHGYGIFQLSTGEIHEGPWKDGMYSLEDVNVVHKLVQGTDGMYGLEDVNVV
eukprot:286749_1